jgi:uncharacterized membrane protein HdeD (DUF308 family)
VSSPQRSPSQRLATDKLAVVRHAYWLVLVLRAVPAIAVGLVITFTEDHSPRVGLIAFGLFAVITGVVLLFGTLRAVLDGVLRSIFVTQASISLVAGIASVLLWGSGIGTLLFTVTVYTALTGALELYAGLRSRGVQPARDWLTLGVFTAVAALVFVLIPPDSILATGLIGAYGIILGVFLLIAGFSLKWGPEKAGASDPVEGKVSP